jgi:restriction system protein
MNFLDAAYEILKESEEPLHYTKIADRALARKLIAPKGQTPAATMGSRLYVDTKKENTRFRRASKGFFGLADKTHSDEIAQRVDAINKRTHKRLKQLLHDMPADRFEALVSELLLAIGFDENTVEVTRYHGDGGVDVRGILQAGGITRINAAVQVKRWRANISAPTVRNLRGALTTHEQGIIITTSGFSKGARHEAEAIGKTPISLVGGNELLELLIQHGIGIDKEQHTVLSLDEEWWGELIGTTSEDIELSTTEPETAVPNLTFPVTVRATNKPAQTAKLINRNGRMRYNGQEYSSPSGAGKDASGWKSCNGWNYWQFYSADTDNWHPIQYLRGKANK